jgi:hypothetical protein
LRRREGPRADAVAGGAFPIDTHTSKRLAHAQRFVLDAPRIQLIPPLPHAIRVAPFAD